MTINGQTFQVMKYAIPAVLGLLVAAVTWLSSTTLDNAQAVALQAQINREQADDISRHAETLSRLSVVEVGVDRLNGSIDALRAEMAGRTASRYTLDQATRDWDAQQRVNDRVDRVLGLLDERIRTVERSIGRPGQMSDMQDAGG
ncbi:MAG TPA: hypothetical protein VIC02_03815 [Kineobactrum sp.]